MIQGLKVLPPTWETWMDFLAPGFGPALAVVGIWGSGSMDGTLIDLPISFQRNNKQRDFEASP